MRFDYIIIGFLLFTFTIIAGTMMIGDFNDKYASTGANLSSDSLDKFTNTTNDIFDISQNAKGKMLEGEVSEDQSWESMTKGSYSAVRLVSGTFKLFQNVSSVISEVLGIPPFLANIAFIAFSLIMVFSLVYMIFRFIPR